jgi:cobalt transporter subunit CbtA
VIRFRRLVYLALASGTIAGLLLFVVQHFTLFPLIEKAEVYESAAESASPHHHQDEGWRPSDGLERTAFTVLTTVLTAIAFSAVFWGLTSLVRATLNWRKGLLWGLAAFVCVDLAPSVGLPPQPPGTAVADLYARQQWWLLAVVSTSVGLWLLLDRRKPALVRVPGILLLILPHIIGAPVAQGASAVPAALVHQFAVLSILTTGLFWVALGTVGGLLYARYGYVEAQKRAE